MIKNRYTKFILLLSIGLVGHARLLYGIDQTVPNTMTYYLSVADFALSFITIPTSNISRQPNSCFKLSCRQSYAL